MAVFANTAEGGTNSTTVTTGNSGGASGNAFNAVSGSPIFTTAQAAHGNLSYAIANGSAEYLAWTFTSVGRSFGRAYFRVGSINESRTLVRLMLSGSQVARINMQPGGTVRLTNSVSNATVDESTTTVSNNTWYWVEWDITHTSSSLGSVRLYNAANTLLETISGTSNFGTGCDEARYGTSGSSIDTLWLDGLNFNDTAYPGPFSPGGGSIAFVGQTTLESTTAASQFNISRTTQAGNALVAFIALRASASSAVASVTDTASNTWRFGGMGRHPTSAARVELWFTLNAAAVTQVTVNLDAAVKHAVNLTEWSGLRTTSGYDSGSDTFGSTVTILDSGELTPVAANTVVLASVASTTTGTRTFDNTRGFTELTAFRSTGGSDVIASAAYRVLTSSGTHNSIWNEDAGRNYGGLAVALRGAGESAGAASAPTVTHFDLPITVGANTHQAGYYSTADLTVTDTTVTRLVMVQHGVSRNADDYCSYGIDAVQQANRTATTRVVAPWFVTTSDISNDGETLYWDGDWDEGDQSLTSPWARDFTMSSFEVIDRMIDQAVTSFPNLEKVTFIGNSAGGQFYNRFAAGTALPETYTGIAFRFITMAPSSYLYHDAKRYKSGTMQTLSGAEQSACTGWNTYKWGMTSLNSYMSAVGAAALTANYEARDVFNFCGGLDNDPGDPDLDTTCASNWQGTQRLDRMNKYAIHLADIYGTNPHSFTEVPEIAHEADSMMLSGPVQAAMFNFPIEFVDAGAVSFVADATVAPALPTELQAGDLMVCYTLNTGTAAPGVPSGWTVKLDDQHANSNNRIRLLYRRYQVGDTAPSITFNGAASDINCAQIAAFRGVLATGDPTDAIGTVFEDSSTAAIDIGPIGGLTTTEDGAMVIVVGAQNDDDLHDKVSGDSIGWAEIGDAEDSAAGDDFSYVWNYGAVSTAQTITAKTFLRSTGGTQAGETHGVMWALRPAVSISDTANAEEAAAIATANNATVSTQAGGTQINAQSAAATVAVDNATVTRTGEPLAQVAPATGTANNATVTRTGAPLAQVAPAAAIADNATVTRTGEPQAQVALAIGTAHDATVTVSISDTADAEVAPATATAHDATVSTAVDDTASAEVALATATVDNATINTSETALPQAASAIAVADNATVTRTGEPLAEVAAAFGVAHDATVTRTGEPLAQAATASAVADNATVTVTSDDTANAEVATATALADNATINTSETALPSVAPAAAVAHDATVTASADGQINAQVAAASTLAHDATVNTSESALPQVATATASADLATISTSKAADAGVATASASADNATINTSETALPEVAPAAAAALDATVDVSGQANAQAQVALAAAVADDATISTSKSIDTEVALGIAVASNADISISESPAAEVAPAIATAHDATIDVSGQANVQAQVATASGIADDATISTSESPVAEVAPANGVAHDATILVGQQASATEATASAAALNATIEIRSNVQVAEAAAAAENAAASVLREVFAETATAMGVAHDATIEQSSNPDSQVALVAAAALNAQIFIEFGAYTATAEGLAYIPLDIAGGLAVATSRSEVTSGVTSGGESGGFGSQSTVTQSATSQSSTTPRTTSRSTTGG